MQGVKLFNFSGSGSVWVQQRFQISVQLRLRFKCIETLQFGFAPVKIFQNRFIKLRFKFAVKNDIILVTQFRKMKRTK